jgi:hypothetical protein
MFKTDRYEVIEKMIPPEFANFAYNYLLLKRNAVKYMYDNRIVPKNSPGLGTWAEEQVPGTYSTYGDFFMETMLISILPTMSKITGRELVPSYSYARIYKKGDKLYRHVDRPSCELSGTIHLGGEPWGIHIDPTGQRGVESGNNTTTVVKPNAVPGKEVVLKPGDMMVYEGTVLEHWRETFTGENHAQMFLHYADKNGPFGKSMLYDGRKMLGTQKDFYIWFC